MKTQADHVGNLSAKLLACVLVLVCLVLGAVGLILPIIPGLLFLGIGVLIAARQFPSLRRRLRKNRALGRHLDRADRFFDLSLWGKVQVGGWVCVKMLVESVALIGSSVTKLLLWIGGGNSRPAR